MRLTPAASSSVTENERPLIATMKFTGRDSAEHTVRTAFEIRQCGGEQHVGAGLLERLQAANRVVQVRIAAQIVLGSCRQHERERQSARGFDGGADALDGLVEIEQRLARLAGRILDRAADEAGLGCEPDRRSNDVRRVAETLLEVGGDGDVRRRADRARLRQASARVTAPSRRPSTFADAPLEVASASNPSPASRRAEPASQTFAITNARGCACRAWNFVALSCWLVGMGLSISCWVE